MEVGFTFLYCVLACIQMYILMAVGMIAFYRGILNTKKSSVISTIIVRYLLPIYIILKLSQVVDIELLDTYWVLIVNFVVEIIVGYCLSLLFHVILKMDVRIKECFGAMNMIPALGALPLVIGKGFCFPSGPVDGDKLCDNFLGLLMLCLLIYNIAVYIIAYFLFVIDKNKYLEIEPKLQTLWHKVINKYHKGKNITVELLMKKYINKKNYKECYEQFEKCYENGAPTEKEEIISYYNKVFEVIENNIEVNKEEEYKKNKEEIIEGLNQVPMKLPHTKGITINNEIFAFIRSEWTNTEVEVKTIKPEYELKIEYMKLDILEVFNKCLSPPLVATLIGIILSVSNVRSLIYDTKNNYWSNLVDGVSMIAQTYTPLIFGLMGLSSVTANTDISELLASKVHVAVIMIIRFLIMPFLGMFNIYMWKEYYGGIVKESTAYRLLMFTHWCLPSASNMTLIINMTKYFGNEYGYLILICNMFCIIGLSVLNLLYFVIVGL